MAFNVVFVTFSTSVQFLQLKKVLHFTTENRVFLFVSALLRYCSLCWDCWNGTWHLHLTRPSLFALGRVLIWVERYNTISNVAAKRCAFIYIIVIENVRKDSTLVEVDIFLPLFVSFLYNYLEHTKYQK